MELFQPNNLSRLRPEFTPLNDSALLSLVGSLLREHYVLPDASSIRLAQFVGPNVASRNLRVELGDDLYFLKSRAEDKYDALAAEAELGARLAEMGVQAPRVKRTVNGEFVSLHGGSCWALYAFEDGDYFSGKRSELDEAAKTFVELTRAASTLFNDRARPSGGSEDSFLEELAPLLDQGVASANPEINNLCKSHRTNILIHLQRVRSKRSLVELQTLPLHLDYHPLNLIMRQGKVRCILDLEHLKQYPTPAGLGFAAYKLIRQVMVDASIRAQELSQPSLVERWLEPWHGSFPQPRYNAMELGLGAIYRVLALIHLILSASLKRGDDRSTYDLEKQIGSLYEIDVIFGGR